MEETTAPAAEAFAQEQERGVDDAVAKAAAGREEEKNCCRGLRFGGSPEAQGYALVSVLRLRWHSVRRRERKTFLFLPRPHHQKDLRECKAGTQVAAGT